jgi:hypothetical protein
VFLVIKVAGQVCHLAKDTGKSTPVGNIVFDLEIEAVLAAIPKKCQVGWAKFVYYCSKFPMNSYMPVIIPIDVCKICGENIASTVGVNLKGQMG